MSPTPDVSIVIPAFNEEKLLAGSLGAVKTAAARAFEPAGVEWELVVCDNNSTDRTAQIARAEGARVVFEPINQIGRARNTGAAAANGRWLLFIDADSHPSPGLLAGATMTTDDGPAIFHFCCGIWNLVSRLRRLVAGSFILVRAEDFREVGGFDLKFFAGEEIDFALRMKKVVGRRERRKAVVLHRHPILTSARKLKLYGPGEIARFLLRAIFRPRRTTASREACALWYDGRR